MFFATRSVKHGIMYENSAFAKYSCQYKVIYSPVGLVVNPAISFLGASPDRSILTADKELKLIEIKCSFSLFERKSSVQKQISSSSFCLTRENGEVTLEKNHDYFYQIQGQMDRPRRKIKVQDVLEALDERNDSELSDLSEESDYDDPDFVTKPFVNSMNNPDRMSSGNDSNLSDDEPLANMQAHPPQVQPRRRATNQPAYRWRRQQFTTPDTAFTGDALSGPEKGKVNTPYEYFCKFITDDMLENVVQQSNEYSMEKNGTPAKLTFKELQLVIGMYLHMGLVKMPGVRMYWENATRYPPVADVMSKNRFRYVLTVLHFANNTSATDEEKRDKVWKIRPWLDKFRTNCLKTEPEEFNSVDEIMVPFKGKFSSIRQYIKNKPHKWGLKMWARTAISGILYDFDVYQGGGGARTALGVGGDVVMKLSETLPHNKNYKVFADNYFSGLPLVVSLRNLGIHYIGTIRPNRLPQCTIISDKELAKKNRGSVDEIVETNSNVVVVKWYDNRCVSLISSFIGATPIDDVRRWDKSKRKFVSVQRPNIVKLYNAYMGGVDLLDGYTSLYKFPMKSRRWYLYLYWHTIMIAVVNAWLLYRRDCKFLGVPTKEIMNNRTFQASIAATLVQLNTQRTRGRPIADEKSPKPIKCIRKAPVSDVQKDSFTNYFKVISAVKQTQFLI
ncbi:PiggyBac transposable element-derived protein 3 [Nymphon striatum]|nr:PiggyBac transposable element-derived protein 3 [Nymphon striatum]